MVRRSVPGGMATTATKSAGVEIIGIVPADETKIFRLDKTIIDGTGSFFEDQRDELALIGQDLAKELNIIRFLIDSIVISNLKSQEIPASVTDKLQTLSGERFQNEKKFDKAVNSVLSKNDSKKYFHQIKSEAWSYREGSRLTLTFLDKDNNQVGARFRIAGIYDTTEAQEVIRRSMSDYARAFPHM